MARPIHDIAFEIWNDWDKVRTNRNHPARPYVQAMTCISNITDNYGADSAKSIVLYFLSNARGWQGDTAKRIKAELKAMTK